MCTIRLSRDEDVLSITEIYAYYVLNTASTFELTPPTSIEMSSRRADVLDKRLPYLVAEEEGAVVGYAYCNWFKPRAAYRYAAELSIYLKKEMCGKGLGRRLLDALMHEAELAGIRKMIAGIGDSMNEGSIGLHRSAGFTHVGTLKSCGWKFNRWIDVIFMEKFIGNGDQTSPE